MFAIWFIAGALALACILAYRLGLFDRMLLRVALGLLAWLVVGAGAFADDGTVIHALPFYKLYVEPLLISAISAVIAGLFAWGLTIAQGRLAILRTDTALRIEAQARDIIQTGATNMAGRIVAASEGPVSKIVVDVKSPAVVAAANELAGKVGPELAKINVTPEQVQATLSHLVAGKVGILQAGALGAVTNPSQEATAVPSAKQVTL